MHRNEDRFECLMPTIKWLLTANKYKRSTATEIYLAAVYNTNYHKIKDFLRTHQTIRFMPPPPFKKNQNGQHEWVYIPRLFWS